MSWKKKRLVFEVSHVKLKDSCGLLLVLFKFWYIIIIIIIEVITTFAQKAFQQNIWRSHCYMILLSQEKFFMFASLFHKRKRIYSQIMMKNIRKVRLNRTECKLIQTTCPLLVFEFPYLGWQTLFTRIKIPADCCESISEQRRDNSMIIWLVKKRNTWF